jgi:hypothetical protein
MNDNGLIASNRSEGIFNFGHFELSSLANHGSSMFINFHF